MVVIGRDGADARLLSKVWRSTLYRDAGPSVAITRSAQLEHRAYMHLMAAKAGVPVSEVVIAASGGRDDAALLALVDPDGHPLSELASDEITDDVLDSAWASLARLHDARLAHGRWRRRTSSSDRTGRRPARLRPWVGRWTDRATRSRPGRPARVHRRLWSATTGRWRRRCEPSVPMGSPSSCRWSPPRRSRPAARHAIEDPRKRLKQLREAGAELSGCEVPKLTELRRVSAEQPGHGGRHVPRLLPDRRPVRRRRPRRDAWPTPSGRGSLVARAALVRTAVLRARSR